MRQEVYRVAYDEASAELSEILAKFEQLRVRKDRIEKVVDALKPLVVGSETSHRPSEAPVRSNEAPVRSNEAPVRTNEAPVRTMEGSLAPVMRQEAAPEPVPVAAAPAPPAPSPIPYPVQQAVEEANDPFSRRVETAIGAGSASKDLREYSRLFGSGTSR
jgi:hypothetical protein